MSAIEYIPALLKKDPNLALILLDYETTFIHLLAKIADEEEEEPKKKKKCRVWVRPYLQRRRIQGFYENLMQELAAEDPELYKNFLRMDSDLFHEICARVAPYVRRKLTWFRKPIGVEERVASTLRFLATGDSYKSIGFAFRIAPNTLSKIVREVCRAIIRVYGDEVLKTPNSPEEWKNVAKGFEERWNLPHAIGAIDGKHIRIKNPKLAGSVYFNHKRYFSIVLLAMVDADYKFLFTDVGAVGSESDAGIFAHSKLNELFENSQANLPLPEPLPGDPQGMPIEYFMVGDDAFALRTWMMKPYPSRGLNIQERIYNYRISRGRRVVENAFGILANR